MSTGTIRTITFGTRKSKLARWQTDHIIAMLKAAWSGLDCRIETFDTEGDRNIDQPLPEIGGKGLFTARLERALREHVIDVAVHSLKDLPTADSPGLTLGAISDRVDVRDVLVAREGWTLQTLPQGAVIGTSSVRRQSQLLRVRPDLVVKPIRGNVETRLRKVMEGEYAATILAAAGVDRLALLKSEAERLPLEVMLPAPGQGALAVQCRVDDEATLEVLSRIEDPEVREAVSAERAFLEGLGGGCSAPVAAYAVPSNGGRGVVMTGIVAATDGGRSVRVEGSGEDGHTLGKRLADEAIAAGASEFLAEADAQVAGPLPLQGKRIVVTRATNQASDICESLARLGAVPVQLPTIRIAPVENGHGHGRITESISNSDWTVFTSANGVDMFWAMLAEEVIGKDIFGGVKVAAVGPATARALAERGVEADFVPSRFTGETIAAELGEVVGQRIVLLRAETAGEDIVRMLTERGATVEDVPVYRTVPESVDREKLNELEKGVDAIVYTSGSTVRNFVMALASLGHSEEFLKNTPAACIGPVTARKARALGLNVRVVADQHTSQGLLDALVSYFNKGDSV